MRRGDAGRYGYDCDITDHPERREREERERGSKRDNHRKRAKLMQQQCIRDIAILH
jgi:hypothetical protein